MRRFEREYRAGKDIARQAHIRFTDGTYSEYYVRWLERELTLARKKRDEWEEEAHHMGTWKEPTARKGKGGRNA